MGVVCRSIAWRGKAHADLKFMRDGDCRRILRVFAGCVANYRIIHAVMSGQNAVDKHQGNAMTFEEIVVTKLRQLPENERQQLLVLIDTWIEQHRTADPSDIQQAMAFPLL